MSPVADAAAPASIPASVPAYDAADVIGLPVTAVTLMEDRAQVEREAAVHLDAGVGRLRLGPVSPLAVDRSLRAEFATAAEGGAAGDGAPGRGDAAGTSGTSGAPESGAADAVGRGREAAPAPAPAPAHVRVLDVRVIRAYTPPPPGEPGREASQLRREVHALEREHEEAGQARQRLEAALAVIAQAKTDLHRDITQGAGAGAADPERWADRLDRVDDAAEQRIGELHRLRRRLHDIDEELRDARQALAAVESEPAVLTAYIELVVEADRPGPARLHVAHLVPCAVWRPAYRAALAADRLSVRLETEAFVWQDTGEDWNGVRLSLSTARPTLAANPPVLADDVITLRDRSAEERRTVDVGLREEDIRDLGGDSPAGPNTAHTPAGGAELPGLDDGGAVRVLHAPHAVTLPADRRPHRVRLSAFTAPCRTELGCAPELSPLVVTTARFVNIAGHVLLAGPVDLVRGSGFAGRGRMEFAGVGEEVRLAFGSEDTFRVVRHQEESRDTTGLAGINQRTVITRYVRLFVSRLDVPGDGAEREVVVRERVPVSEVSAVEVALRPDACRPEPEGPDADGVVVHRLRLAPGARMQIDLVYDITASSAVIGL